MIDTTSIDQIASASRRRPGPFGPVWALLPKDQQPLVIDDDTPAHDAIERMVDNNYSQLPVKDSGGRIIGVFTWKSFGKRVCDLRRAAGTFKPVEMPVREAMEPARFIDPEVYIDTETDWGDIDYVLVGHHEDLMGILCISDVFGRLNDFAEAFVLLYEIEHEIRDLIRDVYTEDELTKVFENVAKGHSRPAREAAATLSRVLDRDPSIITGKENIEAAKFAIHYLEEGTQSRPITDLKDFTFAQYREVIFNKANWRRFETVFDTMRGIVDADFSAINDLRNIVFHFRRGITPKDTDRLRRFRDKLRYDRELYAKKQSTEIVTGR